jgi:[ribosomal protein S5]-alanine N-acetyltransferase
VLPLQEDRRHRYDAAMNSDSQSSIGPSDGVVLTTRRLTLRAVGEADILQLHEKIFSVPEVMAWAFAGAALSPAESESFVRANFNFKGEPIGLCALVETASGEIIGFAGLNPCHVLSGDDLEFGFVLAREAWGRGLATEIGRAQLAFGFEQLGRARLLGLASAENAASIVVLKKLGMRHHADVTPSGRSSRRLYCIGADEWRRQA